MRIFKTAVLISIVALPACTIGRSGKDVFYAVGPGGPQVVTIVRGVRATGELIAVRPDGIIVNSHGVLRHIPFAVLSELTAAKLPREYSIVPREAISSEKRERLRLISRFPHGLTPEIERLLLAQLNQQAIATEQ